MTTYLSVKHLFAEQRKIHVQYYISNKGLFVVTDTKLATALYNKNNWLT